MRLFLLPWFEKDVTVAGKAFDLELLTDRWIQPNAHYFSWQGQSGLAQPFPAAAAFVATLACSIQIFDLIEVFLYQAIVSRVNTPFQVDEWKCGHGTLRTAVRSCSYSSRLGLPSP